MAARRLRTEDTGKMFEMAICLAYDISYNGIYKYDMERCQTLKPRLARLTELFPACYHTANRCGQYDFTTTDNQQHLSAKTTKKGAGKVAPQVIGQTTPKKFCELLQIHPLMSVVNAPAAYTDVPTLKTYIQEHIAQIMPVLVDYTFDCPTVYYNEDTGCIRFIRLSGAIDWASQTFAWTRTGADWKNSSTLKVTTPAGQTLSLLEIQFHTKSRSNMAIRWVYEHFLTLFRESLAITEL